ncbi:MAG: C10 family peptidase, partial [Candidatus Cloacimonadaceae bacterium]|nr:C10 family peptidase [Candidatus Cloacimonadaceae bacterium]
MLQHLKIWNTVLIACLWLFCGVLAAEFITPAQALNNSGKWIRHFQPNASTSLKQLQVYLDGKFSPISEQRVFLGNDDLPELYFVNFVDDTFAILPADDNLPPILAYSTKPQSVGATLPPAFYAIMEAYASNVRHCRITGTTKPDYQRHWQQSAADDFSFINSTREINPLIDVTWKQSWPYNELCPADPAGSGGHVPAGCMAVAMAQMIKYWNRPLQGSGSNSYICPNYGYQSVNFGDTIYQWDQMPPVLQAPNLPVATLLYHCGVSMNMQYSVTGSGAYWYYVPDALRNHFNYPGATFLQRADYPDSLWINLLKDQLDQGIPLWYSGSTQTVGHVFNIDGYQANDYFHVNFGWGGSGNGYYHIDAINPGFTGYNLDQTAIINAVPQDYAIDGVKVRFRAYDAQLTHPITVSISTDPILPGWNVDSYNLSISYPHEGMQFDSAEIGETISEGGNLLVNTSEPGLLQLSWTRDNPLLGGGALLKINFLSTETGSYLIIPVAMDYAGVSVEGMGEVMVSVHSTIDSPAGSLLRLSNALRVHYGETATLNLFTSYLPPSWN